MGIRELWILAIACAACKRPEPIVFYPHTDETPVAADGTPEAATPPAPPAVKRTPGRIDLAVGITPISMIVRGKTLVITDALGAIYVIAADGSEQKPRKLSDQHGVGFAYHAFEAGGEVLATARGGLVHIALPDGPVTKLAVRGLPESPESAIGDATYAYVSIFRHDDVLRIPVKGGDAQRIALLKNSVLGTSGQTIYAASYTTGELFALSASGKPTPIAHGLARPTAVTADATAAYIYCEGDETLRRVELATGAITTLAEHLVNSKELRLDGPWIYTRTWGQPDKSAEGRTRSIAAGDAKGNDKSAEGRTRSIAAGDAKGNDKLVRIAKDGKRPMQVLADDLAEPQAIVVTPDAVFVGSKGKRTIVRLDRAHLPE